MRKITLLLGLAVLFGFSTMAQKNLNKPNGLATSKKVVTEIPYGKIPSTTSAVSKSTLQHPFINVPNKLNTLKALTKVFCYVAYDPSSVLPVGPAYTYLEDPATIVSLADQSAQNFVAAGTMGDGQIWYGAVYTDNTLITLDTATGARTVIGSIGAAISGLSYDYSSDKLYGVAWDGTNSLLYEISTTTGAGTLIGTCTTDLLINLACDETGNLYSVGITNDLLYSVDKTTGAATSIGSIGFNASYAQDMEFDLNTGICYMAAYNATASSGQLLTVNVTTGATTLIGAFAGGAEITGFAIPGKPPVAHCDISPTALMAPLSSDSLSTSDSIRVKVANNDTVAHTAIPITYVIDGGTPVTETINASIPGQSYIVYTFQQPYDFSAPGHVFAVKIYTAYPCDTVNDNDTLNTTVSNVFDAASVSIDVLPIVAPGSINPLATVKNNGTVAVNFDVTLNIDVYTSTQTVTNLAPGATQQVTFAPWTATLGSYTAEMYTQLVNDADNNNDTITKTISVQDLIKAYCYVAYDPSSTLPVGPAYTYLQSPSVIISLADQSTQQFVGAGTWGLGNKWYGEVYGDNNLITLDTVTGARTLIGNSGVSLSGIAYDYTTNTLYGVDWNTTSSTSSLFSINTANGSATLIGTSSTDLLINLACDTLGNLYSLGITNDLLYSIDKSTGVATSIGAIGFDASYAQDMEFDHYTNTCYLAAYNATSSSGEMYTVNTTTGAATLIGAFANSAEITGLAIPYNFTGSIIDAGVSSVVSPSNDTTCVLSASETITVMITNFGTDTLSNFDVSYQINGGTPVTETVVGPLVPSGSISHTFAGTEDLSAYGTYIIKSYTNVTGDINNANDTITKIVMSADGVIVVNIQTDNYGSETTWELIDNVTSQVVASGGPYTNVTGGELISTNVCALSTHCYTFNIYDAYGDGICCSYGNGYYEIVWNGVSFGQVPGSFTTSATLTNICAPLTTDAGVVAITDPVNACTLTSTEDVTVGIRNFGTDPISNFQVSYVLNTGTPVTATVTQTVNSGDTLYYTFTGAQAADLSANGTYTITAYTTLTGDTYTFNDTASTTVVTGPSTVPFVMGFEPTENYAGWTVIDANGDGYTWGITSTGGNNGPYCAMYPYNAASAADDWLITNCITFETGKTYHVSYYYKVYSATYPESFDVYIGSDPIVASLTTQLATHPNLTNTTYSQGGADFTVTANDNYYIGFHCNSASNMWNLYLDDINITDVTSITETADDSHIGIYPNPAKDVLNVSSSVTIERIKLMNAFGQLVLWNEVNDSHTYLNTSSLNDGIYYMQIETADSKTINKKVSIIK